MIADFAFVCDYADAVGPKVHALGIGFDAIYTPRIPATRSFFYVARVTASCLETGGRDLVIEIRDDDGNVIAEINDEIEFVCRDPTVPPFRNLRIAFRNVLFPRYGQYVIHLLIGGQQLHRTPIRVVQTQQIA